MPRFLSSASLRLALTIGALSLLRLVARGMPEARVWGMDVLADLDLPLALLFSILPLLPFLPGLTSRLTAWEEQSNTRSGRVGWALLTTALLATFLLFPQSTFLYGDGGLLIPQIYRVVQGLPADVGLLLNLKSSPLAGGLLYLATTWTPAILQAFSLPLPTTALYPFTVLSLLFGLLFFGGLLLRPRAGLSSQEALAVLGTAGGLFFFSHAEFYTPVFVLLTLFLISGRAYLEGGVRIWVPVLLFVLSVTAHYYSLALLPAVVYLLGYRRLVRPLRIAGLVWIVGLVMGMGLTAFLPESRILMPLGPVEGPAGIHSYSLLHPAHLLDLLNLPLLLAPVALAVLILYARRAVSSPPLVFFCIGTMFFSLFLLLGNTSLGLARDWDLAAPLGILLALWALHVLKTREERSLAPAFVLSSLLFILPWFVVSINPSTAVSRFERILDRDASLVYRDYTLSGIEALRKHAVSVKDSTAILVWTQRKITLLDYPQHYREYLSLLESTTGADHATRRERQAWLIDHMRSRTGELLRRGQSRDYAISLAALDTLTEWTACQAYFFGTWPELEPQLRALSSSLPGSFGLQVIRGLVAYEQRDFPLAIEELQTSINRALPLPRLYLLLGTALASQKRYSESLRTLEAGVDRFPGDPDLLFFLGKYYVQAGIRLDVARTLLLTARSLTTDPARVEDIDRHLSLAESRLSR